MKLNVKHRHWDYTCSDGCCYEYGVNTTIECKGREYYYSGHDERDNILKFFKEVLEFEIEEKEEFDYENIDKDLGYD